MSVFNTSVLLLTMNFVITLSKYVEEKVLVIHRGGCNNKVYYRLSHDVVT